MGNNFSRFLALNAYALVVSGLLLSLPHPPLDWLAALPWSHWGTALFESATAGKPVETGAVWIALAATELLAASLGFLVSGFFLARERLVKAPVKRPPVAAPQAEEQIFSPLQGRGNSISKALLEDPELQRLMRDIDQRLRA